MSRIPAAVKVFVLAFSAYALSAQVWAHPTSLAPHYVYLAHSLLHGHVDLIQIPPVTYDLLHYNGQWFVAGSPMPAIMMLPFVAIFGVGFSDVLFSVVLGAIDVALVYGLLGIFVGRHDTAENPVIARRPKADEAIFSSHSEIASRPAGARNDAPHLVISESSRRWIVLLFAFGTPFWYLASLGNYWFTAHVVAVFFTLLAAREALTRQRWFLAGFWLACAGFARPTALFLAPFFLIVMLDVARRLRLRFTPYVLRSLLPFALAVAIGVAAHFAYNYARFKSSADFGYAYVAGAQNITSVYARYGGFNPRFVPCNLAVSLFSPPEVSGGVPTFITQACAYLLEGVNLSDTSAPITPNPLGMSIFLVTPALSIVFASFGAHLKKRLTRPSAPCPCPTRHWRVGGPLGVDSTAFRSERDPLTIAAWVGLLTTLIPLWLYHNTGSLQFGYRYLFDAAPLWIILLAAGMQKVTGLKRGLILVSIVINLWGFLWMFEKLIGKPWGA